MSDPRIDKLANAFAILLVAIIDVAKGADEIKISGATGVDVQAEPAKTTRAKRTTTAAAEVVEQVGVTDAPKAEAVVGDPDLFEKVKELTKDISKAKGREAAVELLGTFGAERATALKPDQWAEYVEAAEAVLEGDLV